MNVTEIGLKDILNYDELKSLFGNFSATTGYDIALYDAAGEKQIGAENETSICSRVNDRSKCVEAIVYAGNKSRELGEPYIFEGYCGMILCAIAICYADKLKGTIVCGPVRLWEDDELGRKELTTRVHGMIPDIMADELNRIPETSCEKLSAAVNILSGLINHITQQAEKILRQKVEIEVIQDKLAKLDRENETTKISARQLAGKSDPGEYPFRLEKELILYVQMGDCYKARELMNVFLNKIFCFANGELSLIKARLYEFIAYLSRATVEIGIPLEDITPQLKKSARLMEPNLDYVELSRLAVEILDGFLDRIFSNKETISAGRYLVKALQFINSHYAENIALNDVAADVGVSAYYLSHLFRRELKTTYFAYLSKVRINKAKELLYNSDLSLDDIARCVGFSEASGLSKAFKKQVGIPPAQYKKLWQ